MPLNRSFRTIRIRLLVCFLLKDTSYESSTGHYGLNGVRERVEGGTLLIKPGQERGTVIEVELPLIPALA